MHKHMVIGKLNQKSAAVTTFVAGFLLCLIALQATNTGIPIPFVPAPILLIVLGWMGVPWLLVVSIGAAAMWAWNPGSFAGKADVPIRTYILFLSFTVLSILHNIAGWTYGKQYQGESHTLVVTIINASLITALLITGIVTWRRSGFSLNLLFHWLLFAWLVSYAFPYLGEWP